MYIFNKRRKSSEILKISIYNKNKDLYYRGKESYIVAEASNSLRGLRRRLLALLF